MARPKAPLAPVVPVSFNDGKTVTISQQALNLCRQIVAAQGWAKSILDIYTGGKLLAEGLPKLDSTEWVKTEAQIKALTAEERAEYLAKDKEWGAKQITFEVNETQRAAIERAFQHFAATAASAKALGPNEFLLELIVAFEIKDAPAEGAAKA